MDKLIIKATLETLYASCHEALTGDWDKSDDGFEAMMYSIEELAEKLKIKLPDYDEDNENII